MDSYKAGTMTVQKPGHAMENSTRFVVEVYDSSTECIATEVKLEVSNVSGFAADLGLAGFESHATYDLNDEDIKRINKCFGSNISVDAGPAKLRAWLDIEDRKSVV